MAKKLANVAKATNPKYLSMVKTPANKAGFKIIRSDEPEEPIEESDKFKTSRSRRMDSVDGMLYISLPAGFTEVQALEVMSDFGLEEDYELQMSEGQVRLVRSDMIDKELPTTVAIRLDDKSTAYISEASFSNTLSLRSDSMIGGAVLAGIEFEGHSDRDVEKYLAEKNIDIPEENIERIDEETFYVKYKEGDAKRTDRVNLADGINAKVYRADTNDIPESIQRGIVESCYGSYGYGQLDFFASLSDTLYTDAAYDAAYRLSDILREITIYSGLNLSSRIDLMNNALSQYGFYMAELMNSLPRSVVSVMTSDISKTSDKEETTMAGETKKDDTTPETVEAKRSDDVVVEDKGAAVADVEPKAEEAKRSDDVDAEKAEPTEELLKRSDVQAMIDAAVATAVKAVRADEPAKPDTVSKDAGEDDDAAKEETTTRSDDVIATLAKSVETLASKVEEMGDTSAVRYDNGSAPAADNGGVFQGAIFGK